MTGGWAEGELEAVAAADELEIAPRKGDGTLPAPTTIWVVRVGDHVYVRSWRGPTGSWYQAGQQTREGRIHAGGVDKDVRFVDVADDIDAAVNDAYRTKYRQYAGSYLEPMLRPQARATTLKLVPLGDGSAQ